MTEQTHIILEYSFLTEYMGPSLIAISVAVLRTEIGGGKKIIIRIIRSFPWKWRKILIIISFCVVFWDVVFLSSFFFIISVMASD